MKILSVIAAAAVTLGTTAFADGHSEDPAVTARQAHMQLYAHNIGILGGMAQGKADYDADLAQVAADNLAAVAALDERTYWIEGTAEGTKALPAIWENMDDFMAKQQMMVDASAAMTLVAGTDLAGLQDAMRDLGGACSVCHREYRKRNN